ncbi:pilus assembly protein N-terminal domain-containing protein [Roseibium litorale]|uniref:Pilus assembly protein N-terminal domain-containing protein n=1 Tax=Roseibium litorale TaxID=2803841 RepID=A0ABR9CN71_9HYPH|nr:pilus assembly protein N-terminal domain-containing protein [Roseibium litorale]MBD8892328.1 pilus assembly protein N-terminal domain-containing protein [Roseibium litorale]
MRTDFKKLIGMASLLAAAPCAQAAAGEGVHVVMDHAKVFRIEEPASSVIVGNPLIADVVMQDRYTVVVTGKLYGSTNLVILDAKNEPIIDEVVTVGSPTANTVVVTRNAVQDTYSCSPQCDPTLKVGNSETGFKVLAEQASSRNDLSLGAATGSAAPSSN